MDLDLQELAGNFAPIHQITSPDPSPLPQPAATARQAGPSNVNRDKSPKRQRQANFTSVESEILAKAWVRASTESIDAASGKRNDIKAHFFDCVERYYSQLKPSGYPTRTPASLENHFTTILQAACGTFEAFYAPLVNASGTNEEISLAQARELYKTKVGKAFTDNQYLAWRVLRSEPKWRSFSQQGSYTAYDFGKSEGEATESGIISPKRERAPSMKKSKLELQARALAEQRFEIFQQVREQMVHDSREREKVQAEQRKQREDRRAEEQKVREEARKARDEVRQGEMKQMLELLAALIKK